jgi:coenzyme F420-dependent glucose-6-phosphate dehydrogenase
VTTVGFHASHEQIPPSTLLSAVERAEAAGFDAAMCSDHFAPWTKAQGESGYAWAWLGAALGRTTLPFGVVTAPGQRYHPAVTAQAIATLDEMFPGRFWAALGSGEAMNEHITGEGWPAKDVRNARLRECADVIRRLLAGEEVTHTGLVSIDRARLWTLPSHPPALLAAAVSAATAELVAEWADGLITVAQTPDALARVVDAYRSAGGRGTIALQVHVSYAASDAEALRIASEQWRAGVVGPPLAWDLDSPEAFEAASADATEDDIRAAVMVSSDPRELADRIAALIALGFDSVYLHHVGTEQDAFIDMAGDELVPALRS